MRYLAALIALAVAGTALPARADDANGNVVQLPDQVVVKKRSVVDFNDVTVEGELTKPEGSYGLVRGNTRFRSLIRKRLDFNPELQKSVDNL